MNTKGLTGMLQLTRPWSDHQPIASVKIRTIYHARDLWNWLGLANSCVYYARQPREIYQVLPSSVDFKDPWSFEIHYVHDVREYLENIA